MNTFEWVKISFSNLGFDIDENLVRKSLRHISFKRQSPSYDFVEQRISITQSSLNKQCFYIVLSIAVLQPDFLRAHEDKELFFEDALDVEVLINGFEERGWQTPMHYSIEDHREFESDFFRRILPWLDKFAEPQVLISVLKGESNFGAPHKIPQRSIISSITNFLFRRPQKEQKKPGISNNSVNQKFLGHILYLHGDVLGAIAHMQQWINCFSPNDKMVQPYREKVKEIAGSVASDRVERTG